MEKGLILVTGANGFVGKHVVAQLIEAGYRVRGTVRSGEKAAAVTDTISRMVGVERASGFETVVCDLLADQGWAEAMTGASAVMHTAAQILGYEPKDPDEVVRPALEGTERVFRFANAAGIKRLVMTSSIATVGYGHPRGVTHFTEDHFTNLEGPMRPWAYCVGKTKAERFAWDFAKEHGIGLTTIHPGAIIGPTPDKDPSISIGLVAGLLSGKIPAHTPVGFAVIDVRDVAALHVAALQKPEAVGQRYLATAAVTPSSEIAKLLSAAYPQYPMPDKQVPMWILKLMLRFDPRVKQIANDIGVQRSYDGRKAQALLGRPFITPRDAVIATAESLFEQGLVERRP